MKNPFLFILLFSCLSLAAQHQADSLLKLLPALAENEKAHVLNQLSVSFQEDDSARSLGYAREALALARKSDNRPEIGDALFNAGECYYCFEEFSLALKSYQQALEVIQALDDKERLGDIYNSISLVHYFRSEYDLAIKNQMEALRSLKNSNSKRTMARVYSNIGMVYSRIGDDRRSINYYREAVALNQEEGNMDGVAVNYNGIGIGYYNMGKFDSSVINYHIALKGFRAVNDREKIAITLNNIANVFVDQGDSLTQALDYFRQALSVFEELNDVRNATFVLESLGAAYLVMGEETKALEILQSGLELAKKHRIGYFIQSTCYKDITRAYEKMGKVNEAYASYKLYKAYEDSLHQEERIRQAAELEKKFETEKKEEEILRLNAEHEIVSLQVQKEKAIRTFVTVVLLLAIGIMIYISYAYYQKKKTNTVLNQKNEQIEQQRNELEKINATKNRFFSILAHDLKNPFHTILGYASLLDNDYGRFSDEERKKYAGDIYKSANIVFRLLQNLLDWSRAQTGSLTYNPVSFELKQLSESVLSLLKPLADQKGITLDNRINGGVFLYADPMMMETILRNLLSNAIKFSYPEGHVSISAGKNPQEQVTICVSDDGAGLSEDDLRQLFRIDSTVRRKGTGGEEGSGLGLAICKDFVGTNKGTIRVESEPGRGSRFYVTIPAMVPKAEL
ncbi:MAG: tetratricopeptide repeat protein [Prolixibacteraceae bacterium]